MFPTEEILRQNSKTEMAGKINIYDYDLESVLSIDCKAAGSSRKNLAIPRSTLRK